VYPLSYLLKEPDKPDDAPYKPDDKGGPSSGSGVRLLERLDKPDAASGLKDRIGKGLLALRLGFVGSG
jgi:hypothetical protein